MSVCVCSCACVAGILLQNSPQGLKKNKKQLIRSLTTRVLNCRTETQWKEGNTSDFCLCYSTLVIITLFLPGMLGKHGLSDTEIK